MLISKSWRFNMIKVKCRTVRLIWARVGDFFVFTCVDTWSSDLKCAGNNFKIVDFNISINNIIEQNTTFNSIIVVFILKPIVHHTSV